MAKGKKQKEEEKVGQLKDTEREAYELKLQQREAREEEERKKKSEEPEFAIGSKEWNNWAKLRDLDAAGSGRGRGKKGKGSKSGLKKKSTLAPRRETITSEI